MTGQTDEEWTCSKEGCDLDADGHDLALAMEHIYEIEPQAARGAAERTLGKVAALFLDDAPENTDPCPFDGGKHERYWSVVHEVYICNKCGQERSSTRLGDSNPPPTAQHRSEDT